MSDKLKFKDEEIYDEVTEIAGKTDKKPKIKRKNPKIADEPPIDGETPINYPAAENDGGGEIPDVDADTSETTKVDTEADNPADVLTDELDEPKQPKLYERESSLKFTREPKKSEKPENPIETPVKKRKKVFGAWGDTAADAEPNRNTYTPADEAVNDDVTVENNTTESDTVDDSAHEPAAEHDSNNETSDADSTAEPKKPATAEIPILPPSAVPFAAVPTRKLAKPKKTVKSASKLKFTKDEKPKTKDEKAKFKEDKRAAKQDDKIGELQYKTDLNAYKREKARAKQPTEKKKVKERVFDEKTGKAKTKLRFEETPIPINEAKWNLPKKQSLPVKGTAALTAAGVNKIHSKIYEVERENVGTQAAHRAELVGESAYRGGKKLIHTTYRFAKNTPYRREIKFETKTIKSRMKLDYQKALKDNPKLKSNVLSRFTQKRNIKRQYAAALRDAKKTGQTLKATGKATGGIVAKAGKIVNGIVRKNPVFMLKAGLLLLIIIVIMAMLSMCVSMLGGGSGVFGAASYAAADEDITQADLSYTERETDLQLEILNAETTHSGYDEYRYNVDSIGHNPLELTAFLTAVYQDFTYADIESVLQGIFAEQYTLEFVPEIEIRTRTETRTDYYTGADGIVYSYTYEVEVEYEWHILNVNLTSQSFSSVITPLMTDDQKEHFNILMLTNGARQYGSSPFETTSWLPNVTSYYGYRVHPITGVRDLHRGIDIAMPEGTEILAGIDGVVTVAIFDSSYGNYIVIKNEDGIEMKYAHCHTLLFSAGQTVATGNVIATVGTTGSSTGNHLHMEILKDGVYLNPIYFVMTHTY